MRKFLLAATVLLAFNGLVGLATSAYGIPFGPPSIVSGDKTFSGFDCTLTPSGPCNTMLAVVGRISTTPPDSAPGLFGLRFTGAFSNPLLRTS
jgi:hypothetical protein